jgi:hypothetical protein
MAKMFEVDDKGMDKFRNDLTVLEKEFPKQAKQMLVRVGNKAKVIVVKKARQLVKEDTGRYHKSIKRGIVFKDDATGELTVRVYSTDPKKHLIEDGHMIVDKNGNEHGFKPGYKVFDKSGQDIEQEFDDILEAEFDRILSKL